MCGLYDPDRQTLRWARAGHPPPLLVRGGAATALPTPSGIRLGAISEAHYEEQVLDLRPGDELLMYTDGAIERGDSLLDTSLRRLLAAAPGPFPRLGEQLDHLLADSEAHTDDDTCLVGIRLT